MKKGSLQVKELRPCAFLARFLAFQVAEFTCRTRCVFLGESDEKGIPKFAFLWDAMSHFTLQGLASANGVVATHGIRNVLLKGTGWDFFDASTQILVHKFYGPSNEGLSSLVRLCAIKCNSTRKLMCLFLNLT